ncbi:MAG: hypothetical protein R2710_17035 [Acidimicrobiales bacterium]
MFDPTLFNPALLNPALFDPTLLASTPQLRPERSPTPPRAKVSPPATTSPPTVARRLRLVPSTLGIVAPDVARVLNDHPAGLQLVELTSPDTGRCSTFEPFSVPERLLGYEPDADVDALAVTDHSVTSIVWRNGTSFRASLDGGDPRHAPVVSLHHGDDPVVDVLRRCFGLPTVPSLHGPCWYWLAVWLHDLAARSANEVIDVIDAARWHPGIDPDEIDDDDDPAEVARLSLDRLYEHARATGWSGIREGAMHGWLDLGRCSPSLARWLDDPSFARFLGRQLGSSALVVDRHVDVDPRWSAETVELFRLMLDGLSSVRALDCHR